MRKLTIYIIYIIYIIVLIIVGFVTAIIKICFYFKRRLLSIKAMRDRKVTSILAFISAESSSSEDTNSTEYRYINNRSGILCMIDSVLYHGVNDPASLEMTEALMVPVQSGAFCNYVCDRSWWPAGVEYILGVNQGSGIPVNIKVYVDIASSDDPVDDLQAYIGYLGELQTDLVRRFNQFNN